MAYTPDQLARMIADRAAADDPSLAAVEAVLLRSAFERLDDFLLWLDEHTAREHPDAAASTSAVVSTARHRIAAEVLQVDTALTRIEE
jgi:hypothetical protein